MPICARELPPLVEDALQRGRVCRKQYIGHDGLCDQVGPLRLDAQVDVPTDVREWETVETTLSNMGEVVGRQIVAEIATLVDVGPQVACRWIDGNPNRIAKAAGVDAT